MRELSIGTANRVSLTGLLCPICQSSFGLRPPPLNLVCELPGLDAAIEADLDAAVEADLDAAVEADLDAAVEADLDAAAEADLYLFGKV